MPKRDDSYLAEASHHLLYKRPHRGHIDDLKLIHIDCTVAVDVFSNLPQHCQESNICFSCTL